MRRLLILMLALAAAPRVATSQQQLLVIVSSAATGAPVAGAAVRMARSARSTRTDRLGRARFVDVTRPDTIVVAAVGFRPDTIPLPAGVTELSAELEPQAVTLADVTVTGDRGTTVAPSLAGQWTLPREVMLNAPAAVQPDPLRALAFVPSVSFSSPLSSRPVIRGYDAADGMMRIDGFEILNPYHIGRIFSSVPADAVESVAVTPTPTSSADGGTLSGFVDLRGRTAVDETAAAGGGELSIVSGTAWFGTQTPARTFAAGRAAFLEAATDLIAESGVPYNFLDFYGNATIPFGARRAWDISFYASGDDFANKVDTTGMEWSNVLVGNRWRLLDGAAGRLDVTASFNRFSEDGFELDARNSRVDVANRFDRAGVGVSGEWKGHALGLTGGFALGRRRIANSLEVPTGDDFEPFDRETELVEARSFAEARAVAGRFELTGGVRLDASSSAVTVQPRARVTAWLSDRLAASVTAARASRLFQLITDQQPEPTLSFFDVWLNAGENGVPVPSVYHVAADLDATGVTWSLHGSVFWSRGTGLGELRPLSDQRTGAAPFRFGDSRTRGIELRAGWRPGGTSGGSAVLTYVLSQSQRRWEDGVWRPWRLDRRHALRLQYEQPLGNWYLFAAGEFMTGQPVTPVAEIVIPVTPIVGNEMLPTPPLRYRFAEEGSGRSAGTVHVDLGARVQVGGPGGSRISLGFSVLNLGYGPVAPEVPASPFEFLCAREGPGRTCNADGSDSDVNALYERLFKLPPVPSITARIEF